MTLEIPSEPAEWNFYTIKNLFEIYTMCKCMHYHCSRYMLLHWNKPNCALCNYGLSKWMMRDIPYTIQWNWKTGVWIDSMTKCTQDMQTQTDLCDHSIVSKHCVGKKSLQLFTNFPYYYGFNAPTMLEITNVSFQFSKRLQITLKKNATKLAVKCSSDINFLNHRNGKV